MDKKNLTGHETMYHIYKTSNRIIKSNLIIITKIQENKKTSRRNRCDVIDHYFTVLVVTKIS